MVTEFEVRLHPLTSVTLAQGLTAEADIRRLLEFWREFMADAPIDLKWNIDLRLAPNERKVPVDLRGHPVANSSLVWTGSPEEGQKYVRQALSLCHPDSVNSHVVSLLHLQTMADSGFPDLGDQFGGQTAVVTGQTDVAPVAKIFKSFASEFKVAALKVGFVDRAVLSTAELETLAELPAREVLQAQLLGLLLSPATRLVRLLNEPAAALARLLNAKAEKEGTLAA